MPPSPPFHLGRSANTATEPRGILRMPGKKNEVAKSVFFAHPPMALGFLETEQETEKWIGKMDVSRRRSQPSSTPLTSSQVASDTPADQCFTEDGEPIVHRRYIHVHVARLSSPRPSSQARFGFGAPFPVGMGLRGWQCMDKEKKEYTRYYGSQRRIHTECGDRCTRRFWTWGMDEVADCKERGKARPEIGAEYMERLVTDKFCD